MTRVRRRRDPRGVLGTQMDSGPRLAVLPLPRGVCRSGATAHPELGGDTALRTPFTGHAGRAGPGAPGGSASSAMSGAVSHQAAERTWATRPSVSTPAPAGFPPWWQDPPRSTALVPGAAAPAGPEPQPHRSGPAACCGAGGRGQAQEAAVSGLPGSAEGGGRGLTYPAASSASTKSLSLPGSQKGSSWAPSRPCPCCRALRAKDAALWSAEGHTRGGQCRPQGPGSLWKPA